MGLIIIYSFAHLIEFFHTSFFSKSDKFSVMTNNNFNIVDALIEISIKQSLLLVCQYELTCYFLILCYNYFATMILFRYC